ncbi:MAG: hypothetical protein ACYCO5_10295 [Acidobacteriaceae bacterium]
MSLRSLGERVRRLEGRGNNADATLEFASGQTLAVRVSNPLALVCDVMRKVHAKDAGEPSPASRYDKTIAAFERATGVLPGAEPLFELAHDILHSGAE